MTQLVPTLSPTGDTGAGWPGTWGDIRDSLLSSHSGTAEPSYKAYGLLWLDTSTKELKFYDGASSIVIFKVDTTAHKIAFNSNFGIGIANALEVLHSYKSGVSDKVLHRQENGTRAWSTGARGDLTDTPWGVRDETVGADRLLIDKFGNLIAGGAAPATNASHTLFGQNAGWCLALKPRSGGNGWGLLVDQPSGVTTGYMAYFASNATGIGSIQFNTATSSVSYVTTSDRRLKDGIQPVSNALGTILKLKPCSAYFVTDPEKKRQVMFIADEVEQVMPETVTGKGKDAVTEIGELRDADGKVVAENYYAEMGVPPNHSFVKTKEGPLYQGLDYAKFTPMLVAAVQEMWAEIQSLKAQIASPQPNP